MAEAMLLHVFHIHGFLRDICVRPGTSVHLPVLEGFLQTPGGHSQSHLWLSPPIQRPNREPLPGVRDLPALISQNPATWSKHLIWVEYAHNTLPGSASGLYQPPLLPAQENEVMVPSAHVPSLISMSSVPASFFSVSVLVFGFCLVFS